MHEQSDRSVKTGEIFSERSGTNYYGMTIDQVEGAIYDENFKE